MKKVFLIILIIVMILLISSNYIKGFYNWFSGNVKEGLQSGPYLTETTINQYNPNKLVFKLYDNLYYDNTSGNVIEVNTDPSNNVIVNIFPRNFGDINYIYYQYNATTSVSQITENSLISSLVSANSAWSYKSTSKYQLTLIPFNNDTYMHIMDISTQTPDIILSAYFTDPVTENTNSYYVWSKTSNSGETTLSKNLGVETTTYSGTSSSTDKTNVIEPYYDSSKALYQISKYVKYDAANGNICIEKHTNDGDKKIDVYSRADGSKTTYDASNNATTLGGSTPSSSMSSFVTNTTNPILIKEKISPSIIIYWPVNKKTVIVQYKGVLDTNNYGMSMLSVTLFDNTTIYTPSSDATTATTSSTDISSNTTTSTTSTTSSTDISSNSTTAANSSINLSDMMRMMWIWQNIGGDATYSSNYQLSDYVPKTSIVPPVCPSCPACPGVTCPSCNGAAAMRDASFSKLSNYGGSDINAPHEATGGLIDKTGTAIGHGIASTGRFIGEGVENTASFAKSGIENTASFAKSAITETAEGVGGAAKYVGSGVGNFLGRVTGGGGGGGGGSTASGVPNMGYNGTSTDGSFKPDVYSYGGAIPSQYQTQGQLPNVQPLIADFSKFGR